MQPALISRFQRIQSRIDSRWRTRFATLAKTSRIGLIIAGTGIGACFAQVLGDKTGVQVVLPGDAPPVPPNFHPRGFPATGHFLNLSTRGFVGSGESVLIGGLVVSAGDRVVLIRAVGPTLSTMKIEKPLAEPRLELFDSDGKSITVAVPWSSTSDYVQRELRNVAKEVGAFPLVEGSRDQVLLIHLKQGIYTCIVSGMNDTTGIALLEAYEVSATPAFPSS